LNNHLGVFLNYLSNTPQYPQLPTAAWVTSFSPWAPPYPPWRLAPSCASVQLLLISPASNILKRKFSRPQSNVTLTNFNVCSFVWFYICYFSLHTQLLGTYIYFLICNTLNLSLRNLISSRVFIGTYTLLASKTK